MKIRSYFLGQVILSLALWLIYNWFFSTLTPVLVLITVGFPALTSSVAYLLLFPSLKVNQNIFMMRLLSSMAIKIFAGMILIAIIAIKFKMYISEFVISYFISYFIFTGFEVFGLMRNLRSDLKK